MKNLRMAGAAAALLLVGSGLWRLAAVGEEAPKTTRFMTPSRQQQLAREEVVLVEGVVAARERYIEDLTKLVEFYRRVKNGYKLKLAEQELNAVKGITQYRYLIVAEALGADLRPTKNIPEAETLYKKARQLHTTVDNAYEMDKNRRKALELYLSLISQYPESLRISEAAYWAATIYDENVKDYYRAVVYYEKTYQWDPMTEHPARIRAARVCYNNLKDYPWAKHLYQVAGESSPHPPYRTEGKAMAAHVARMGY